MRWIAGLILLLLLGFAGLYVAAGRSAPPALTINQPSGRFVGQTGSVDVIAEAPNATFSTLTITFEQNGRTVPLFSRWPTACCRWRLARSRRWQRCQGETGHPHPLRRRLSPPPT